MSSSSPAPLKVNNAPSITTPARKKTGTSGSGGGGETGPGSSSSPANGAGAGTKKTMAFGKKEKENSGVLGNEISSPLELTTWVENALSELESRFDDMSSQMVERMNEMSSRVETLEQSISDLINGTAGLPSAPASSTARTGTASSEGGASAAG